MFMKYSAQGPGGGKNLAFPSLEGLMNALKSGGRNADAKNAHWWGDAVESSCISFIHQIAP